MVANPFCAAKASISGKRSLTTGPQPSFSSASAWFPVPPPMSARRSPGCARKSQFHRDENRAARGSRLVVCRGLLRVIGKQATHVAVPAIAQRCARTS
jgi:hypothetical protein